MLLIWDMTCFVGVRDCFEGITHDNLIVPLFFRQILALLKAADKDITVTTHTASTLAATIRPMYHTVHMEMKLKWLLQKKCKNYLDAFLIRGFNILEKVGLPFRKAAYYNITLNMV